MSDLKLSDIQKEISNLSEGQLAFINEKLKYLTTGFLYPLGWFNSTPTTSASRTLPWFTYPSIYYLENIVTKDNRVFEYGAGYSTMFFEYWAGECNSVDHDPSWTAKLVPPEGSKVNVHLREEGHPVQPESLELLEKYRSMGFHSPVVEERDHNIKHGLLNDEFAGYAGEIFSKPAGYYDIIVVDGMARMLCAFYAAHMIAEDGIIILDNSDRWQYDAIQHYLIEQGFGRIDFWGIGPVNTQQWCTSFFSKQYKIPVKKIDRNRPSPDMGW
jgi:hypothetical protein